MKKFSLIVVILVLLCFNGCNENINYTFMQPIENISAIDIIYIDSYRSYNSYDQMEAMYTIPPEQWMLFVDDFNTITCKKHGMDPTYDISGSTIRIAYTDGSHEVIAAGATVHVSSNDIGRETMFRFEKDEFDALIARYCEDRGQGDGGQGDGSPVSSQSDE